MISFRFSGVPVHVKPTFWLMALFIGWRVPDFVSVDRYTYLVGWVAIVFFSVLAHELGHAFTARRFGAEVEITLHVMGGHTVWATAQPISPLRRVVVAAAGSGVGFVMSGALFAGSRFDGGFTSEAASDFATLFLFVNVFWGIVNWLPIRPLDGGHILTGFLQAILGRGATVVTNLIFPVTTAAVGWFAYDSGFLFGAIFCGFLLLDEVRAWQDRGPRPAPSPEGGELPPALG